MYSQKIILQNLEAFHRREGWMPVEHSQAQVDEFKEYIDKITTQDRNKKSLRIELNQTLTSKRANEIRRWIENEQIMCCLSAGYFEDRYAYVCDEKGEIFKFKNRKGQEVYDNVIADFDEQQVAIMLLILKARQLGITTKTALRFLHRILFVPNTQAVMGSVDQLKSELITRIIETCIQRTPWWLLPQRTTDRIKLIGFGNGSIMSVQSGSQATGIAQGWTPTCVHVCLSPETLVRVNAGFVKKLRDVIPGQSVLVSTGKYAQVRAVVKSKRENEMACELSLWGNYAPLVCTRDHPILTPDGFTPAEEVNKKDFVCMPVRAISHTVKNFNLFHRKHRISKNKPEKKETIELNRWWGWLCGLYLAEGSLHKNVRIKGNPVDSVYFSIHKKEINYVRTMIAKAVGHGRHFGVYESKRSQSACVTLCNAGLARWLEQEFGNGADRKFIPDWVFDAGEEFVYGMIKGYLEGDGCISSVHPIISCHSISLPLMIQLRDLLAASGFGWSCLYCQPEGNYYGRQCQTQWMLTLNGDYARKLRKVMDWPSVEKKKVVFDLDHPNCSSAPKHWKYSEDGKFIHIQVFENRAVPCEEFYDLEVDAEEHDFCTIQCCVKNSEIGDIPNPKKTIEEGLLRAVHSSRKLFLVLEGTGNGNIGWQADKWRAAKEDWPLGKSELFPFFLNWPMAPDLYPEADWLRKFPINNGDVSTWKPLEETRKHVQRCELYIRNTPYLARVVGKNWRMPIEQQWFWEFKYLEHVKIHAQKIWFSQMPADDFEALQGANDLVFDPIVIETVRKEAQPKYQAYAITGDQIDEGFDVDDTLIDYEKERIRVTWNSHRGQKYEWTMIPLLPFDDKEEISSLDKLLVFEPPNMAPGHEGEAQDYSIGVDTSDGLGKVEDDRCVLSGTRNMGNEKSDIQVFEFSSIRMNPPQTVGFAACIAAWYGQNTKDPRGVKFVIEQRTRSGDDCQFQLSLMGFKYHHIPTQYDTKNVKENSGQRMGWWSFDWSVAMLMNRFVDAVNGGWYKPNSPYLIRELGSLERQVANSGKTKMKHQSGKHDDRVRAAAQSYFTRHAFDILAERSQKRYAPPTTKKPELDLSHANIAQVSVGSW